MSEDLDQVKASYGFLAVLRYISVLIRPKLWPADPWRVDLDRYAAAPYATPPTRNILHGSFVIVRLLTPLGLAHAGSMERYAPYNRIVLAQLQMRREAPAIIQEASAQGVASSIIERKLCAADHASDY